MARIYIPDIYTPTCILTKALNVSRRPGRDPRQHGATPAGPVRQLRGPTCSRPRQT